MLVVTRIASFTRTEQLNHRLIYWLKGEQIPPFSLSGCPKFGKSAGNKANIISADDLACYQFRYTGIIEKNKYMYHFKTSRYVNGENWLWVKLNSNYWKTILYESILFRESKLLSCENWRWILFKLVYDGRCHITYNANLSEEIIVFNRISFSAPCSVLISLPRYFTMKNLTSLLACRFQYIS